MGRQEKDRTLTVALLLGDLGESLPCCVPICEMRIRKCHTRSHWVINRGLWLRFWNSPRGWEVHLFFIVQSKQGTQISLTLLSIEIRENCSPKHFSWGKQVYEYVTFFFPNTNGSKLLTKLKCLVWLLHYKTSDRNLNINWSACCSHSRKPNRCSGQKESFWLCRMEKFP